MCAEDEAKCYKTSQATLINIFLNSHEKMHEIHNIRLFDSKSSSFSILSSFFLSC